MVLDQLYIISKTMKLKPYVHYKLKLTQNNLHINLRDKTIKILEKNIGINLCDLRIGNGFLHMALKTQVTKEKNIHWTSSNF